MDMTLMVALTKEIAEEPWAQDEFGPDNAAKILAVLMVTAGAFLAVLLIYRLLVTRLVGKKVRP